MKYLPPIALSLLLGAIAGSAPWAAASAQSSTQPFVEVVAPYVRAVPPGVPNSAAFMTLRNTGSRALTLVGASSPVAQAVELHAHQMNDGVMSMRRIDEIAIAPLGKVVLKPGGLHIMLIGLTRALKPGSPVELTLHFADGSKKKLAAPVVMPGRAKR